MTFFTVTCHRPDVNFSAAERVEVRQGATVPAAVGWRVWGTVGKTVSGPAVPGPEGHDGDLVERHLPRGNTGRRSAFRSRAGRIGVTDSSNSQPRMGSNDGHDLCRPFLSSLPVSGASVAVTTASGVRMTLCSSGVVAARIDELQFELGEGPQSSVARSGHLVMVPDVASGGHDDWPVLGAALSELSVGAIFCVPIQMGAVTVGVATLYSDRPLTLDHHQQTTALMIASAIAGGAVQQAMVSAMDDTALESLAAPALRREVHQATGIVLVQLDTTATIAYARIQAYAFANGQTVLTVARDVVAGSLIFDETRCRGNNLGKEDDDNRDT